MFIPKSYPKLIKYMGSKSKIMDFVTLGLNVAAEKDRPVIDLFAGSASLAGAVGIQHNFISNDIQSYSEVFAKTYLESLAKESVPSSKTLVWQANEIVMANKKALNFLYPSYSNSMNLKTFNALEKEQKKLINKHFSYDYHIFTKNYSGTWWSYEQCLWIDAFREVAQQYQQQTIYPFILSSLMYAIAYSSQGTGHFAQYRDATTKRALTDICKYRRKKIHILFTTKYDEVCHAAKIREKTFKSEYMSLDYKEALNHFSGGTVYADPPYCPFHYSRFYHILETLVLYDHPNITERNGSIVKGRYREDRHRSPFSMKGTVNEAFIDLFKGVKQTNSTLVLSYSNAGLIDIETLLEMAAAVFSLQRVDLLTIDSQHSTIGRQGKGKGFKEVKEYLLLAE